MNISTTPHTSKRRNGFTIMASLIGLVRPLMPVMLLAVTAGVLGFLCAIFITVFGGEAVIAGLRTSFSTGKPLFGLGLGSLALVLFALAVLRGALHYCEQYCNHYIAFKLLALIRHNVFSVLRQLAPAKLEGRDKGNLITLITTDIELLEVFYAHTISPIIIAVLTSFCMLVFFGSIHILAAFIALIAYITVGLIIPIRNGKKTRNSGFAFRTAFGDLNSFVLESLRGLEEIMHYGAADRIRAELKHRSENLAAMGGYLNTQEARQRIATNTAVLFFTFTQLFLSIVLFRSSSIDFAAALRITLGMSASFGPVIALSQLSNNLHQTLASGDRILSLLEEAPLVTDIPSDGKEYVFEGAEVRHVDFGYGNALLLKDFSARIQKNGITGIYGQSGSGKSTLLKLLMRFWQVHRGEILISDKNIESIPTASLRTMEAFVTQESQLFKGTIADNIRIGTLNASEGQVIAAAQKASIHAFIAHLPQGYNTPVGELGETLSGGERQRIGLARAFLHDGPFLLLDEPTSNLDVLNEAIILKSLKDCSAQKTVILVSHRKSTLNIADSIIAMPESK